MPRTLEKRKVFILTEDNKTETALTSDWSLEELNTKLVEAARKNCVAYVELKTGGYVGSGGRIIIKLVPNQLADSEEIKRYMQSEVCWE